MTGRSGGGFPRDYEGEKRSTSPYSYPMPPPSRYPPPTGQTFRYRSGGDDLPVDPVSLDMWDEEIARWNPSPCAPGPNGHPFAGARRPQYSGAFADFHTPPPVPSSYYTPWGEPSPSSDLFGVNSMPSSNVKRAASLPVSMGPAPPSAPEPTFDSHSSASGNVQRPVPHRYSPSSERKPSLPLSAYTPSPLRQVASYPATSHPEYSSYPSHPSPVPDRHTSRESNPPQSYPPRSPERPRSTGNEPAHISLTEKTDSFAPKLSAFTHSSGAFPFPCDVCDSDSSLLAKQRGNMTTSCEHYVACNECRGRTVRRLLRCVACCTDLCHGFPVCQPDRCVGQPGKDEALNTGNCPRCGERLTKELCRPECTRRKSEAYNQMRLTLLDRVGVLVREPSTCLRPGEPVGMRPCSHFSYCAAHHQISKGHGKKITCKMCKGLSGRKRQADSEDEQPPSKRACP